MNTKIWFDVESMMAADDRFKGMLAGEYINPDSEMVDGRPWDINISPSAAAEIAVMRTTNQLTKMTS